VLVHLLPYLAIESPPRQRHQSTEWFAHSLHFCDSYSSSLSRTVGLVLDAFHIAGYEYADPTLASGIRPDGPARLAASLEELVKTVPVEKIFYLQLVDAELLSPPLLPLSAPSPAAEEVGKTVSPFHVDGQQPRMSWSRNARRVLSSFSSFLFKGSLSHSYSCRLFPGEQSRGGYMPVSQVYEAFLKTGFEGYVRCATSRPVSSIARTDVLPPAQQPRALHAVHSAVGFVDSEGARRARMEVVEGVAREAWYRGVAGSVDGIKVVGSSLFVLPRRNE
jgi:hypothetical protein